VALGANAQAGQRSTIHSTCYGKPSIQLETAEGAIGLRPKIAVYRTLIIAEPCKANLRLRDESIRTKIIRGSRPCNINCAVNGHRGDNSQ